MNASEFGCGAGHQLAITAAKAGWKLDDFSTLTRSERKCRQVLQFLRGEADLVPKTKAVPEPEPVLNTIIRIDRSIKPTYPDWVKKVIHPELEGVGPAEYDMAKSELWLHDGQKNGKYIVGHKIYEYLKESDSLKNCYGYDDALAIQKNGIDAFRKVFGNKVVYCWRSVVQDQDGDLYVPYVDVNGGELVVYWNDIDFDWYGNEPAGRFAQ